MNLFDIFRREQRERPKTGAEHLKERLQIVLQHDRVSDAQPDYLPALQKEILAVIARYVKIDEKDVTVKLEKGNASSMLAVDVAIPIVERKAAA